MISSQTHAISARLESEMAAKIAKDEAETAKLASETAAKRTANRTLSTPSIAKCICPVLVSTAAEVDGKETKLCNCGNDFLQKCLSLTCEDVAMKCKLCYEGSLDEYCSLCQ